MRKRLQLLLAICWLLVLPLSPAVWGEGTRLLVVTSTQGIGPLSRKQIKQIYLESSTGYPVKPINLAAGAKVRSIFNARIIGLTESRIQAYWAQRRFTGRSSPPMEFESIEALMQFLETNSGYLAYLPDSVSLPETLEVVYSFDY
jgi:hypothetical protein